MNARRSTTILASYSVLAVATWACASEPLQRAADLAAPIAIQAGGRPIEVAGFAAPFVGDFDGDGIADLLVGQRNLGRLRIYKNRGSNAQPRFDSFKWFVAAGRPAAVTNCCKTSFTPQLVDFEGDGRTDILTGSGLGELFLFRRTAQGTFSKAEVLEDRNEQVQLVRDFSRSKPTSWPYNSTVFAYDWDADGDLDLLLGRGRCCMIPNVGTAQRPSFAAAVPINVVGTNRLRHWSSPVMADWDADGLDDLLFIDIRGIVWHRNVGQKGKPVFDPSRLLVAASENRSVRRGHKSDRPARYHSICVADFNGNGHLDLLVGDHWFVPNDPDEPPKLAKQRSDDWAKLAAQLQKMTRRYHDLRRRPKEETRAQRIDRHRRALDAWQALDSLIDSPHRSARLRGRVWLFKRTGS